MKRGIWWAFFLVCGSASAQEGAHLQYVAPTECPSEQQFRELVRARLLGDPHANESAWKESGDGAVSVEVRLDPAHQRATLVLQEPNLPPVERVVTGDSCEELVSGLALITALAFGSGRDAPSATDMTIAEPATAATVNPQPPATVSATPPAARGEPARDSAPPARSAPLAVELGAGAWMNSWAAPSVMWGGDVFARLAPRAQRGWSLRVAGLYGVDSSYVGDRLAEFRFIGGRAEGCPLTQSYYGQRLTGEVCLALEMGALRGSGQASSALLEGASDTVFAATALATGRLRVRIGQRIFFESQADLGVPLLHHEFVFDEPRERIFQTPSVGYSTRLGLGVQFL
ncbi:MAG TPA: hypothetical protein VER96_30900 [Polyangiaceae bacterium]|nr:hypothetical protein [Polyangiaceae bacterium]